MNLLRIVAAVAVAGGMTFVLSCRQSVQTNLQTQLGGSDQSVTSDSASPRISIDEAVAHLIRRVAGLSANDYVYAVRWQHGLLTGWVKFEGGGRQPLPFNDFQRGFVKGLKEQKALAGGLTLDTGLTEFSGLAVILLRKVAPAADNDARDSYDCQLMYELIMPGVILPNDSLRGPIWLKKAADSGEKLPLESFAISSERTAIRFQKLTLNETLDEPWMEMRVVAPGSLDTGERETKGQP